MHGRQRAGHNKSLDAEKTRLLDAANHAQHWRRWGPFLSDRQWGTVREDYSADGTAWEYFPFEHAHLRAYRWGEDGIGGICDNHQRLCFAPAFWNGRDPILKERFYGLTGNQGNHGEDVKEIYYYLDCTPTHSYMKCVYKYPQAEFPYAQLYGENRRRTRLDPEFELIDTRILNDDRYFDVQIEYAKAGIDDPREMERLAKGVEDVAHRRWLVSDDADEHLEQLRPYIELGFNHLVFHAPGDDQARFLELYGSQILPRIRAQWG